MPIRSLNILTRSYRLFPSESAIITIRKRSWLSGLLPSMVYLKEWAGVIK